MDTSQETKNLTINNKTYKFEKPLSGRGQAGAAGFYSCEGNMYLIKEDDPATCLAESLAIMPDEHNSIIQAEIGIATDSTSKRKFPISIQLAFKLDGLDNVLLGHKRKPKTLFSEESWGRNPENITNGIKEFSDEIKEQLASAIYVSQLNGDESLHTGQFVTSVTIATYTKFDPNKSERDSITETVKTKKVSKIQRIDFGALGRFAMARNDFDPLHSSKHYTQSGQRGKDYVSFLLQEPDVKSKLLEYWANTDPEQIVKTVLERFDEQIKHLDGDDAIKKEALTGMFNTLCLGLKPPKKIDENLDLAIQVKGLLEESSRKRCKTMNEKALNYQSQQMECRNSLMKERFSNLRKSHSTDSESRYPSESSTTRSSDPETPDSLYNSHF